jgi:hypothetical protein
VRESEQSGYVDEHNGNDAFATRVVKCMKDSAGLPVGIQVSTLPYEDEKCIAVSRLIEKTLKLKPEILAKPKWKIDTK